MRSFVRRLNEAGGVVVAGTDCIPRCGYGLQEELRLLVESGLSAADALKTATVNAAQVLGWGARLGRVAAGRWADLVLLEANPLRDIASTRRVVGVVAAGRYLDRSALDALLARDKARFALHGDRSATRVAGRR
jgi:imidazolonepropionase-like amidohydrolase